SNPATTASRWPRLAAIRPTTATPMDRCHGHAMIPREPPRRPQLGFLYAPPYRIQGISIAGEETVVHIPELDLCFDIGLAPRAVLPSKYVALSHGHMDHVAGIAYYFSQRNFQGM